MRALFAALLLAPAGPSAARLHSDALGLAGAAPAPVFDGADPRPAALDAPAGEALAEPARPTLAAAPSSGLQGQDSAGGAAAPVRTQGLSGPRTAPAGEAPGKFPWLTVLGFASIAAGAAGGALVGYALGGALAVALGAALGALIVPLVVGLVVAIVKTAT